jgi:hypothetical protein
MTYGQIEQRIAEINDELESLGANVVGVKIGEWNLERIAELNAEYDVLVDML